MRVGVEGSLFFKPRTGVGQYAYKLTEAASKIDSPVRLEIVRHYLPFRKFTPPIAPTKQLSYRLVRWFPPAVYFQVFKRLGWFLPYDLISLRKYDTFLFFNFVDFPLRRKTKGIIVIHDLSFVHYPDYVQRKNLVYLRRFLPKSIERASHIIAVSEATRQDIIKTFSVAADKISVVPNAIDHAVFYPRSKAEIEAAKKKYGLPESYIHFHGTIEPRKNVEGMLNAYAKLPEEIRKQYALVLTGGKGWHDENILARAEELKTAGYNIVFTGYIGPDEDIAAIYSGASLFTLPSFFEGFGIPPLEAMACGVPVITADNSSLPEVVGDGAIKIKAEDTKELSRQIGEVLTNSKLAADLKDRGLAQAKKFSWEQSAQKLIEILESL